MSANVMSFLDSLIKRMCIFGRKYILDNWKEPIFI